MLRDGADYSYSFLADYLIDNPSHSIYIYLFETELHSRIRAFLYPHHIATSIETSGDVESKFDSNCVSAMNGTFWSRVSSEDLFLYSPTLKTSLHAKMCVIVETVCTTTLRTRVRYFQDEHDFISTVPVTVRTTSLFSCLVQTLTPCYI